MARIHIPHEFSARHRALEKLGDFGKKNFGRGHILPRGIPWIIQNAWNPLHHFDRALKFRREGKMIREIYEMKDLVEREPRLKRIESDLLTECHDPNVERHGRGRLMPHEQLQALIEERSALSRIERRLNENKQPLDVDKLIMRLSPNEDPGEWLARKREQLKHLSELINTRANLLSEAGSLRRKLFEKGPGGIAKEAGQLQAESDGFSKEIRKQENSFLLKELESNYYARWNYYGKKSAWDSLGEPRQNPVTGRDV